MTTPGAGRPDEWGTRAPVPASGPSGLSDYAVSPLGVPLALMREQVRVAFVGRTSTEDMQDPRASLVRQLGNCKTPLPESWVIVAHFWDVESGRMSLDARGHGTDYERFDIPIPRDGGIADLLEQARRPDRAWDVVICESVSRVARRAYEGLTVERALEDAEVTLFASNEPISVSGSRAQRILQRRINQSIAEYEVLNTLEQSWGGLCTHTRDGFNIGKPPYGYQGKHLRHPNPAKAARGATKMRLEPDGVRGEAVTQIALWRHQGLGYGAICDRLNADPTRYPPPEPPGGPARARGVWGKSSVHEILRNPKYTGYMVFNRRAARSRRGKVNDPVKWVWSHEPTHEPLIPKWMFDQIRAEAARRRGTRDTDAPDRRPTTRREYVLRGMLHCHCGRRMNGKHKTRNGTDQTWYECFPPSNNRGAPTTHPDSTSSQRSPSTARGGAAGGRAAGGGAARVGAVHDTSTYLNERAVLDALARFYADRIFGPDRMPALRADLDSLDTRAAQRRQAERERLQRVIDTLVRRQAAVRRHAQDSDDPDDPFSAALRTDYNDLDRQRRDALDAVATLDEADSNDPARRYSADDVALLDALPRLRLNLAHAPQPLLRRLFDATRLTVTVHGPAADRITATITLAADTLPTISDTAHDAATAEPTTPDPDSPGDAVVPHPECAPGRAPQGWERWSAGAGSYRWGG